MAIDLSYLLNRSETKLKGVHGTIRDMSIELIKKAYAQGIYVAIVQGYRSYAEQNALYSQGRTSGGAIVTNAKAGYSYHNFGLAVDFCLFDSNKNPVWSVNNKWMSVIRIAQGMGFTSGYYFSTIKDAPHLQLTFGLTLPELRAGKKPPLYRGSSTPIENPTTSPSAPSVLRFNSRGDAVKSLQTKLNKLGYSVGTLDGIFGVKTEQALIRFQKAQGLKQTGIADSATVSKIESELAKSTPPVSTFVKPPKFATKEDFFKYILSYANTAGKGTDIPFEVCIAQWSKESAYGNSVLAQATNNFAGITYTSNSIADFQNGRFAGYNTIDKFVKDYIRVMNLSYYDKVRAATTIEMTCIELGKSPYSANDPTYGTTIFQLIKNNNLSRFGADVVPDPVIIPEIPEIPPIANSPAEMPPVTSLGSSFLVKAKEDLVVYQNADLTGKLRVISRNSIFAVYGYTQNQVAYVAGGGVYVKAADCLPVETVITTGGLSESNEKILRQFLKDNKIDGSIAVYNSTNGNPAAIIKASDLKLVAVKRFIEQMNWYYVAT
ncbi:peptidoglycan-binding protein [Priestia megaterium]|uniref:peptidoglycan-binding protein n=1 Tax=Priestia megaterium TaxID=1404 RepID=UPI002877534C|nr:peptidoglycan-binding protein [Priestia megaterium]